MILVSSLLWALALGGIAWALLQIATCPRIVDPQEGRFEEERRQVLRSARTSYRWMEPWIDELATFFKKSEPRKVNKVSDDLVGSGTSAPWRPEEYIAVIRVEALLAGLGGVALGSALGGPVATLVVGGLAYFGYQAAMFNELHRSSQKRRNSIRRRIASAIDLMALMMEVGASFHESLQAITVQASQHPLGVEFRRILNDLDMGQPRREALQSFAERMRDDDTRDLMAAIIEGETLGTPLASTLQTQAEQLRMKRSQWAEKAAEEAKVAMVFPAMLIMAACLLIVVAPFVLSALYTVGG